MDIAKVRLANQFIDGSRLEHPADVVRALCAVQAQDYYAALWAVGLRLPGARQPLIEQTLNDRLIVRTWPMRGTLHLVASEDVRWLIELLAPRTLKRNAARLEREFGIDAQLIKQARKIVERSLRDNHALTREQLYEQFDAHKIPSAKLRGLHILWWLAHEGVVCCGPRAGKQHTFVLLDEWIAARPKLTKDESLGKLATRYFAHHGPATVADFAWWSGLTITDAKLALDLVRSELTSVAEGETTWWSGPKVTTRRRTACHLLPVYDEFTVGYADRTASLDPGHADRQAAGHGIFRAPIVIHGRIVGSWTRELKKDTALVRVTAFDRFTREQRKLIDEAADRYGDFLNVNASVTVSKE
ncbi:MAG: winged helix DNA-binding domain-containing protein [Povalibacter sp.]|jgi:hypothetical protein